MDSMDLRIRQTVALLFLLGCAARPKAPTHAPAHPPSPSRVPDPAPAPLCTFEGPQEKATLRAGDAGLAFAAVDSAHALARIEPGAGGGEPVLASHVSHEGWHLEGFVPLREDATLFAREPIWLAPWAAVGTGGLLSVEEARPGEVRVGIAHPSGYHADVSTWVACDRLALSSHVGRSPDRRAELGLDPDPRDPPRYLEGGTPLTAEPGSEPVLRIRAGITPLRVAVLESRPALARILIEEWTGLSLLLWVRETALRRTGDSGARTAGILGVLSGSRARYDRCGARGPAALYAETDEPESRTPIGRLDPDAEFEHVDRTDDGLLIVKPLPEHPFRIASGVRFVADIPDDARSAPTCTVVEHDPSTNLGEIFEGLPEDAPTGT